MYRHSNGIFTAVWVFDSSSVHPWTILGLAVQGSCNYQQWSFYSSFSDHDIFHHLNIFCKLQCAIKWICGILFNGKIFLQYGQGIYYYLLTTGNTEKPWKVLTTVIFLSTSVTKKEEGWHSATKWRPSTIISVIVWLFHKILTDLQFCIFFDLWTVWGPFKLNPNVTKVYYNVSQMPLKCRLKNIWLHSPLETGCGLRSLQDHWIL